jgi:L-alanine-DL-glutamate epimerase-like enolase superfamily enzyme
MNIARIEWTAYRVPFRAPFVTARGTVEARQGMLFRIVTDDGIEGLGEAAGLPDATDMASLLLDAPLLAAGVIGRDVISLMREGVSFLNSREVAVALETAAFDCYARYLNVPCCQVLAGSIEDRRLPERVRVNALIGGVGADDVARQAEAARAAGFDTVKLKVGVSQKLSEELARVSAAREALGPEIRLRLDANGAWYRELAFATMRTLLRYDIEYVEQPLPQGWLQSTSRLRSELRQHPMSSAADLTEQPPIAIDEDVTDWASAQAVIDAEAASILVFKPLLSSGYADFVEFARAGFPVVVTTSIDTGVGTALALQIAAAVGGSYAHGLATLDLLEDDLIAAPGLVIEQGSMRLPQGPGLGISLDENALARYSDGWHEAS